jgi:hypothetical protein
MDSWPKLRLCVKGKEFKQRYWSEFSAGDGRVISR